jgi:hypothetical protein
MEIAPSGGGAGANPDGASEIAQAIWPRASCLDQR